MRFVKQRAGEKEKTAAAGLYAPLCAVRGRRPNMSKAQEGQANASDGESAASESWIR